MAPANVNPKRPEAMVLMKGEEPGIRMMSSFSSGPAVCYQIPNPIITTPRAIHPKTPTAMMVSRLIPVGASSTRLFSVSFFMAAGPLKARSVVDQLDDVWLPEWAKQGLCLFSMAIRSSIPHHVGAKNMAGVWSATFELVVQLLSKLLMFQDSAVAPLKDAAR